MFAKLRSRSGGALVCAALAGCGSAPAAAPRETSSTVDHRVATACAAPRAGALALVPLSRQGSAVALARANGTLLAFVADSPGRRVDVVDVSARRVLGTAPLAGTPEEVLALADGRVLVTSKDRAELGVLFLAADGRPTDGSCAVDLGVTTNGIAVAEDGATLAVTSLAAGALTTLDPKTLARRDRITVARAPSGVLVEDGRAFVSHVVGSRISVVPLRGAGPPHEVDLSLLPATQSAPLEAFSRRRSGAQGYALASVTLGGRPAAGEGHPIDGAAPPRRRIVVPHVSVDPGDASRFGVYYGPPPAEGITKESPVVASVDLDSEQPMASHVLALSPVGFGGECLLPRGVASRASTERLYVACRGIDQVLELDARAADPMRSVLGRARIGSGAAGIAIADDEGVAVTFAEFDGTLDVLGLDDGRRDVVTLPPTDARLSVSYRAGRTLFYRSNDPRIAGDGIACASCHPDGGDDGLTWSTPEGPRQTPALAGRVHGTAPYGWTRNMGTLPEYVGSTVERLGGSGLSGDELAALASFVERMPAPAVVATADDVSRGRRVFEASGCSDCHRDVLGTDHLAHEVGGGAAFDTPSLRFVGRSAPYFHDGRYPSLDALLSDPTSEMGRTAAISADDRRALASFLESL